MPKNIVPILLVRIPFAVCLTQTGGLSIPFL